MLRRRVGIPGVAVVIAIAWASLEPVWADLSLGRHHDPVTFTGTQCALYCAGSECWGPAQPHQACKMKYKLWPETGLSFQTCENVPCPNTP